MVHLTRSRLHRLMIMLSLVLAVAVATPELASGKHKRPRHRTSLAGFVPTSLPPEPTDFIPPSTFTCTWNEAELIHDYECQPGAGTGTPTFRLTEPDPETPRTRSASRMHSQPTSVTTTWTGMATRTGTSKAGTAPPALAHPDSAPVFTCNGDDSSDASSYQCGFTFFGHTHTFRVDEIVSVVYQDDQQGTPEQWFVPCDPPPAPCMAIDLVPPDTTITAGPPSKVASREAELRFASSEAGSTFECRLDTGGWQECSSPRRYSSMQDGDHVFEARASDAAGNADPTPSHHGWTVDTIGPRVKIAKRTVRVSRRGLVRLRIRCPGSEASGPCRGKLTIKTVRRLRHAKRVSLGGAAFAISAGRTARISVKLSKRNRRLVTRLERVRTRATARASDRLGNVAATSQTFILAAPRD